MYGRFSDGCLDWFVDYLVEFARTERLSYASAAAAALIAPNGICDMIDPHADGCSLAIARLPGTLTTSPPTA